MGLVYNEQGVVAESAEFVEVGEQQRMVGQDESVACERLRGHVGVCGYRGGGVRVVLAIGRLRQAFEPHRKRRPRVVGEERRHVDHIDRVRFPAVDLLGGGEQPQQQEHEQLAEC